MRRSFVPINGASDQPIDRDPCRVPGFQGLPAYLTLKAGDLAGLRHAFGAAIDRSAFAGSMASFRHTPICPGIWTFSTRLWLRVATALRQVWRRVSLRVRSDAARRRHAKSPGFIQPGPVGILRKGPSGGAWQGHKPPRPGSFQPKRQPALGETAAQAGTILCILPSLRGFGILDYHRWDSYPGSERARASSACRTFRR